MIEVASVFSASDRSFVNKPVKRLFTLKALWDFWEAL